MKSKVKTLDEKDYTILNVLKTEARLSTQQISRKTRIPITTVHNRLKRMESSGVIRGYGAILNPALMGNITAFVLISVMYHLSGGRVIDQEELAGKVSRNPVVEEVSIISGSRDLIVKVRVKSVEELNDFVIKYLRSIPGIERTETAVVLKSI